MLANVSIVGERPHDLFVDTHNTVYVTNERNVTIQIWLENNTALEKKLFSGVDIPRSIFVAINGDMYVDNSAFDRRIDRWSMNSTTGVPEMYVTGTCFGLFIDVNNYLYCSSDPPHQVIKQSLYSDGNASIVVAGNGTAGSGPIMLSGPRGIFVSTRLILYVADCWNHRVQYFQPGQMAGSTMTINGSTGIFSLQCPTEIVLDFDGFPFIVDHGNHRILGSGSDGFRCILGCTNTYGSASNQFNQPHSLGFDNRGNLFVIETMNNRLQTFLLMSNSCSKSFYDHHICLATNSQSEKLRRFPESNKKVLPRCNSLHMSQQFQKNDKRFLRTFLKVPNFTH